MTQGLTLMAGQGSAAAGGLARALASLGATGAGPLGLAVAGLPGVGALVGALASRSAEVTKSVDRQAEAVRAVVAQDLALLGRLERAGMDEAHGLASVRSGLAAVHALRVVGHGPSTRRRLRRAALQAALDVLVGILAEPDGTVAAADWQRACRVAAVLRDELHHAEAVA